MRIKKKLTIGLFGNTGIDDLGSEARLLSTIEDVKEYLGDYLGDIVILTRDEKRQKRFIQGNNIKYLRLTKYLILNPKVWLNSIDAIIVSIDSIKNGHYSPMDHWFFLMFIKTVKMMGTRVLLYSGHVEDLSVSNRRMLRKALKSVGMIELGNMVALSKLKKYNIKNELFCTADNRYLFPDPSETYKTDLLKKLHLNPAIKPIVTVIPREYFTRKIDFIKSNTLIESSSVANRIKRKPSNARESSARYIHQMANYCDWLVNECDTNVVLFGIERRDESIARLIYEKMSNRYKSRMMLSSQYNVDDLCTVLSKSIFQVTGHISSYELGSNYGLPAIGIGSHGRFEMLFREMGQIGNYIDYASKPFNTPNTFKLDEDLKIISEKLFNEERREEESFEILKINATLKNRAEQNIKLLGEWLEQQFLNGENFQLATNE